MIKIILNGHLNSFSNLIGQRQMYRILVQFFIVDFIQCDIKEISKSNNSKRQSFLGTGKSIKVSSIFI